MWCVYCITTALHYWWFVQSVYHIRRRKIAFQTESKQAKLLKQIANMNEIAVRTLWEMHYSLPYFWYYILHNHCITGGLCSLFITYGDAKLHFRKHQSRRS